LASIASKGATAILSAAPALDSVGLNQAQNSKQNTTNGLGYRIIMPP
jgi:hypothetical protein